MEHYRYAFAILVVHYSQPHVFAPEEKKLIEQTTERIWAAVERAHAETAELRMDPDPTNYKHPMRITWLLRGHQFKFFENPLHLRCKWTSR